MAVPEELGGDEMSALLAESRTIASSAGPGPCPVIETERLVLRPHRLDDADAIATVVALLQNAMQLAPSQAPA